MRPAWLYARQCSNLEAVLTFSAIVLETLAVVNDQVERRTYGAQSLRGCITAWESLIRQTRVVLLLASRTGTTASAAAASSVRPSSTGEGGGGEGEATVSEAVHAAHGAAQLQDFTVHNLSTGSVSLHRLLATGRADQAALNLVAAHPKVTLMSKPFSMRELQQNLQNVQAHPA